MALSRDWARAWPPGSLPANTACLPVVLCRQGVQSTAASGTSPPVAVCDVCNARQKRAVRNESAALSPAPTPPPLPPVRQRIFDTSLAAQALPRAVEAPPPHTPSLLLRDMERLKGHSTAIAPVAVTATAQQQPSIDPGAQALAPADVADIFVYAGVRPTGDPHLPSVLRWPLGRELWSGARYVGSWGHFRRNSAASRTPGDPPQAQERASARVCTPAAAAQGSGEKEPEQQAPRGRASAPRKGVTGGAHNAAGTDAALALSRVPLSGTAGGPGGSVVEEPRRF